MPQISGIVSVYKVGPCLRRCVGRLLAARYQKQLPALLGK